MEHYTALDTYNEGSVNMIILLKQSVSQSLNEVLTEPSSYMCVPQRVLTSSHRFVKQR